MQQRGNNNTGIPLCATVAAASSLRIIPDTSKEYFQLDTRHDCYFKIIPISGYFTASIINLYIEVL